MRTLPTFLAAVALAGTAAAQDQPAGTEGAAAATARAEIVDAEGNAIGTATLIQMKNGVLVSATLENLDPGPHGFHVHETGACDAAGGFESAGGHFDPGGASHGFDVEGGPHAGDLPNQTAGEDGRMVVEAFAPGLSLTGAEASLLDDDGSALVVHADPDDYMSQPAGGAGDRIACGVIQQG